jgi:hypothetical protein
MFDHRQAISDGWAGLLYHSYKGFFLAEKCVKLARFGGDFVFRQQFPASLQKIAGFSKRKLTFLSDII